MILPRLIASFAVIGMATSCGHDTNTSEIQQFNAEAWELRFDRATFADELTGIKSQEPSSNQLQAPENWKTILMTGDDSIDAFDNARNKLHEVFSDFGVEHFIQLSRDRASQTDGVRATSVENFRSAVAELDPSATDGCLVHMTSHGTTSGFYIRNGGYLTPTQVDTWLEAECGSVPTIILVSACYSGVFAEPALEAPNRIIFTAARRDRSSFGCSAGATYTYWDGCLIDEIATATNWQQLALQIEQCIEVKESQMGYRRSYPQARFGADVAEMGLFSR